MVMPKVKPAAPAPAASAPAFTSTSVNMKHPHTIAIASATLVVGLALGAAAGYYGSQFQNMFEQTAADAQNVQMQAQDQVQTDATADTYSQVDTNPLQDVQTNPFE
jgi:hypothetical protein